jgi:hypothetical protein
MMPQTAASIAADINAYMARAAVANSHWYVGIASNPTNRLFIDHNVDRENGWWIYCMAMSDSDARMVEQSYLASGCSGGCGGGDHATVYVYAYLKTGRTVQ